MNKCCKCLRPYHSVYCDCAYVDLFGRCTAPKEQFEYCKSVDGVKMTEDDDCEAYIEFLKELKKIREKVENGDTSDFVEL